MIDKKYKANYNEWKKKQKRKSKIKLTTNKEVDEFIKKYKAEAEEE